MNRIEAAARAMAQIEGGDIPENEPNEIDHILAQAAVKAADEPVRELIKRAETRHGSLYCHVTTFELRLALGMDVTNWPNVGDLV